MRVVDNALACFVQASLTAEREAFAAGMAAAGTDAATVKVAGGIAIFTGSGFFSNRVMGWGLGTEVSERDLDRVESFYRERGIDAEIELPSIADRSLVARLASRGYSLQRFRNIYAREISKRERPGIFPGIEVEQVDDRSAQVWREVLLDGFGYSAPEERQHVSRWHEMVRTRPDMASFSASIDGRAVGAASVLVAGKAALLGGAATHPEFRRRGVQRALIEDRLTAAAMSGCDLAIVTADPGGTSARNAERCGFNMVMAHAVMRAPNSER